MHFIMREDEIAKQEGNEIEQRLVEIIQAVGTLSTRLSNQSLLPQPEQHAKQQEPDYACLAAEDTAAPLMEFAGRVNLSHQQ